jgi:putative DNA primase/helicase
MSEVRTLDRAHGRWREILPRFGVDSRFLRNKHGPCPICGGRDRFRFDDRHGQGNYYCNGCGAGTGFTMLKKLTGQTNAEILKAIDEIIGTDCPAAVPRKLDDGDRRKVAALQRLVSARSDDAVVNAYLRSRGITATSPVFIGFRALPYYDGRKHVGNFAAVVVPILSPLGKVISAHRIYVTDAVAERKKFTALASGDTLNGAAVRLCDVDEEMGVAEGIETALAAHQLFGVPVWSVLNANGLVTFRPPSTVRRVHVFGDNDDSGTGQAAAWQLAAALRRAGIEAPVNLPETAESDWLNVLNGGAP